jgi:hypothetical protein
MTAPFAKLWETALGQLLAFKLEDDAGDPSIQFMGELVDCIRPITTLSYHKAEDRDRIFGDLAQDDAESVAAQLRLVAVGFARQ